MSDKRTWRLAAWMSAGILSVLYLAVVPMDIPEGDMAFTVGYKVGYIVALAVFAFVPSWLTRVIENGLRRTNGTYQL